MTPAIHRLTIVFAVLAPGLGVIAPKGLAVVVLVAGLAGLALWVKEGFAAIPVDRAFGFALIALAAWAAVTVIWALNPDRALMLVAALVGLSLAGAGLLFAVSRLDDAHCHTMVDVFLIGMILGLATLASGVAYAKITGVSLWGQYLFDPLTTLNNGAVTCSLLAWPAFAALVRRGMAWIAGATATALIIGLMFLSSGAALLAPACGLVAFAVAWFFGRRGTYALAAILAVAVLSTPWLISNPVSTAAAERFADNLLPSAQHRLTIWAFAVEKIGEKPLIGWGMDASRSIPQDDRRVAGNMEIMPLHPHNAFLQARLELGLPGAVLVAALVGVLFSGAIGGIGERLSRSFAAGTACAYLAVAFVSYGMWQNWWVALGWTLAALIAAAIRPLARKTAPGLPQT